jgi:hypothetical protein
VAEVVQQQVLPAPFIEAPAKAYLGELETAIGGLKGLDVSKLYGQQFVAGPGALQTQAEGLAGGLGGYQPYLQGRSILWRSWTSSTNSCRYGWTSSLSSLYVSISTRCYWNDFTRI